MFNFPFPKTVDGVLKVFNKTIADLNAVGVDLMQEADKNQKIAESYHSKYRAQVAEALRAKGIADKIKSLTT